MDVMTEIFFQCWVGGLSTKSTYGNGVPIYGCNAEISNFSDTEFDSLPFVGSGNHNQSQFLDPRPRPINDEHIDASSPKAKDQGGSIEAQSRTDPKEEGDSKGQDPGCDPTQEGRK